MQFYKKDSMKALDSMNKAQEIVWAPMIFQSAKSLRDLGILAAVEASGEKGVSLEALVEKLNLPLYGVRVLLEAGLGMHLVYQNEEDLYILTKTGFFILNDEMTRVNMDFVHDVCYLPMFELEKSILTGKPEGLKVFGNWPTIYEGLSTLPPKVQESWFAFDHYYSDGSFPLVLPEVFKHKPKMIYDVGGNTGKFSLQCVRYNEDVTVKILDLPQQVEMANKNIKENGFEGRVLFHPINLLDSANQFPKGADIVWMSQFLDCFSEEEIISILSRAKESLNPGGSIFIMETYWDRQKFEAAAMSLQQTSLYFTVIANGNSQMYHSENMIKCIDAAGLYVDEDIDSIGVSHTLFKCKLKS